MCNLHMNTYWAVGKVTERDFLGTFTPVKWHQKLWTIARNPYLNTNLAFDSLHLYYIINLFLPYANNKEADQPAQSDQRLCYSLLS